jgi:hypothetical protein
MDAKSEIMQFISRFAGSEDVFLHGCCYWFARILEERFLHRFELHIKYEPVEGHFVIWIHGRYYDVRGDVTEMYRGKPMYDLDELEKEDNKMYKRLMRDCRDFVTEGW